MEVRVESFLVGVFVLLLVPAVPFYFRIEFGDADAQVINIRP
jgi:hypothetical protein